jgi:tRNA pseudouridine55 synthase
MFFEEGIYKCNKPIGWTSYDVVNWIKHRAVTKKVGHAGTLDPLAEGLLLVAVGRKYTKAMNFLLGQDKEYIFEISFGLTTDTQDISGNVLKKSTDYFLEKENFETVLKQFLGEQEQLPPMYSALKVNGQKLYDLARRGQEVEREKRKITIRELELLSFTKEKALVRAICSKGTYIRTLCHDIGEKLGMGACMSALRRTRIGDFVLDESALVPVSERKGSKGTTSVNLM